MKQPPSIFTDMRNMPATSITIFLCTCIWVYLWNNRVAFQNIAYKYDLVVHEGHYWRVITASVSHIAILHLIFNMASLWQLGSVESIIGSLAYLRISFLLLMLSMGVVTIITYILSKHFNRQSQRETFSLGYSCVVFGWMTIASQMQQGSTNQMNFFGLFSFPMSLAPFGSLIFTSLMIPNASFIGHLSGIVIGYLVSWHVFDWFTNYLALCSFMWTVFFFFFSLKQTTSFPVSFIKIDAAVPDEELGMVTIVGGRLTNTRG